MALYQLLKGAASVLRTTDGACVPTTDPRNADYQAYLAWVAAGNTPDPADPPPVVFADGQPVEGRVRTTDAVPLEIVRVAVPPKTGLTGIVTVIGVDAGNGTTRIVRASVAVKRLLGGAIGVGTPAIVVLANHADAGASTWGGVVFSLAGNDAVVSVSGVAARTIDWALEGVLTRFAPDGLP